MERIRCLGGRTTTICGWWCGGLGASEGGKSKVKNQKSKMNAGTAFPFAASPRARKHESPWTGSEQVFIFDF
jgi:hypothetical protein